MNKNLVYRVYTNIEEIDPIMGYCDDYSDFNTIGEAISYYKDKIKSAVDDFRKFEATISFGKDNGLFFSFSELTCIVASAYHGSIPYFNIFELEDNLKKELDMFHKSLYLKLFKNYEEVYNTMKNEISSWGIS